MDTIYQVKTAVVITGYDRADGSEYTEGGDTSYFKTLKGALDHASCSLSTLGSSVTISPVLLEDDEESTDE